MGADSGVRVLPLNGMTEFAPEDPMNTPEGERIDVLSDAFLAAGEDGAVLDEELDDDPVEPLDV